MVCTAVGQVCGSAYFSPDQERGDVSDRNVARESFDSQVAVVREQDHLPDQPHRPIWWRSTKEETEDDSNLKEHLHRKYSCF